MTNSIKTITMSNKVQSALNAFFQDDQFHYNTSTEQWKVVKTIIDSRVDYINSPNKEYTVKSKVLDYENYPTLYDWTNKLGNISIELNGMMPLEITCQPHRVNQWVNKINNYIQSK